MVQESVSVEQVPPLESGDHLTRAGICHHLCFIYLLAVAINRWGNFSETVGKTLIASTIFGNVGNLGLPMNSFAFGEAGLERAIICLITSAIIRRCRLQSIPC